MKAVAVRPGQEHSARRIDEFDEPRAAEGECLVRVLEVGVDGTDREIDEGRYGEAPEGEDLLILGHEALGRVERGGAGLEEGALVVPTVRRACPERCPNCAAGASDFCSTGDYTERGIKQAHGYLCERFAERPEHLIPVPDDLRDVAVLLEPLSILERSYRLIFEMQRRLVWEPRRVIVTGGGNVGMMAVFLAGLRDLDVLVFSHGPAEGAAARIMEQVGCAYVDSDEASLGETAARFGAPDILIEGTGFSPLAWDGACALAVNGVACLLSVTKGDRMEEIPSDALNTRLVLGNRVLFGSVNARRRDFEQGLEDMRRIRERWPGALEGFITHRRSFDEFREALDEDDPTELKTVIEVAADA